MFLHLNKFTLNSILFFTCLLKFLHRFTNLLNVSILFGILFMLEYRGLQPALSFVACERPSGGVKGQRW